MLPLPDPYRLIPVLARPLRLVPHAIQRSALELGLEQLFRAGVAAGELDFLEGRCLAIEIEDVGWRWPIALEHSSLVVMTRDYPADTVIRGQSPAFLFMATRFEDPDTLFFQRRLIIEGDTELGLGVKNFLDGFDEERLPRVLQHALLAMRTARARLRPNT